MSRIPAASKEDYPSLDKPQRKHIGVLQERRDYLRRRVQETPTAAASYHDSEIAAINWVLHLIDEQYKESCHTIRSSLSTSPAGVEATVD